MEININFETDRELLPEENFRIWKLWFAKEEDCCFEEEEDICFALEAHLTITGKVAQNKYVALMQLVQTHYVQCGQEMLEYCMPIDALADLMEGSKLVNLGVYANTHEDISVKINSVTIEGDATYVLQEDMLPDWLDFETDGIHSDSLPVVSSLRRYQVPSEWLLFWPPDAATRLYTDEDIARYASEWHTTVDELKLQLVEV